MSWRDGRPNLFCNEVRGRHCHHLRPKAHLTAESVVVVLAAIMIVIVLVGIARIVIVVIIIVIVVIIKNGRTPELETPEPSTPQFETSQP